MAAVPLTVQRAREVYDRMGRLQQMHGRYDKAVTARVAEIAGVDQARSVFELGCGSGRLAESLLRNRLAPTASYRGVEISPKMASLARRRLARWAPRAEVVLIDPPGRVLPGTDGQFDRFVACHVLDLLAPSYAQTVLSEASRLLAPDGLLCLVSLTPGATRTGRVVSDTWETISERWPATFGGCRPIELAMLLGTSEWRVERREVLTRWAVSSEVLVATSAARRVEDDDARRFPPRRSPLPYT